MLINNKKILILLLVFLFSCEGKIVRSDFLIEEKQIGANEKILILPVTVLKGIDLGTDALKIMFDTIISTEIRKEGFSIISPEEVKVFLSGSGIETKNLDETELNKIQPDTMKMIIEHFQPAYILKPVFILHQKEEILNILNIFISLKLYQSNGDKIRIISDHYEGENGLESVVIQNVLNQSIERLLNKLMKEE
ncbi:MAG TPA: hypothetical protein DHW82_13720 [Spirochaetia bacterium]|nr:MAG: hypothetical protein A2Y41_09305 [Spirochaetes bacterium GWB1_36_13]HCL58048.1 hypothetical protein [Spirochaetia bacterium]